MVLTSMVLTMTVSTRLALVCGIVCLLVAGGGWFLGTAEEAGTGEGEAMTSLRGLCLLGPTNRIVAGDISRSRLVSSTSSSREPDGCILICAIERGMMIIMDDTTEQKTREGSRRQEPALVQAVTSSLPSWAMPYTRQVLAQAPQDRSCLVWGKERACQGCQEMRRKRIPIDMGGLSRMSFLTALKGDAGLDCCDTSFGPSSECADSAWDSFGRPHSGIHSEDIRGHATRSLPRLS